VDILIDHGEKLDPVEIKSGQTITSDYFKGLNRWINLAEKEDVVGQPYLIFAGSGVQTRGTVEVVPWDKIDVLKDNL
jgi:hypothetical protein